MKIRVWLCLAFLCLGLTSCGKKQEDKETADRSVWDDNMCMTEEGMLYHDPDSDKASYLDYKTWEYFPLCSRANCLHDSLECTAVYLNKATMAIGRLGDKWYYLKLNDDLSATFYCCDLDGGNEKNLGDFSHSFMWADNRAVFWEDSCIAATWDWEFDEKTGEGVGFVSGVYRYHFDSGKAELLCPEKTLEMDGDGYHVYGIYKEQLIYSEWDEGKNGLRVMDLGTGEVSEPLEGFAVSHGYVGGNLLVCCAFDGDNRKIVEIHLDSGEKRELAEPKEGVMEFFWTPELKLLVTHEKVDGRNYYRFYQDTEKEGCVLIREGGSEQYFMPDILYEDMAVGRAGENWFLSYMKTEDFLAGENNWTEFSHK